VSGERVTLQTLADALGVSRTTASNAFNRPDQLNPALRERVLALAAELGYAGPDPAGRALRSGRAGAIGVLLTERLSYAFGDPAAVATLRGLAVEAEASGISLSLLPAPLSGGADAAEVVTRALMDACFVYALPEGHPSVAAVLERRIPVVIADTPHVPGVPLVSIDDRGGARAAAQHLLDLGHRRLAVASLRIREDDRTGLADGARRHEASYRVTRERLAGYADAIAAAGLEWDDVPIYEGHPNSRRLGGEAVTALLERDPPPTALLAMSDEIALGAIFVARAAGLAVPGQLSVVGFDDAPAATSRELTTIRQPLVDKGRTAGRMLLEAIDGGTPADVVLPTELVLRRSTADSCLERRWERPSSA
jgi:DNA-binding LacI/PurR family transcriptional regulator